MHRRAYVATAGTALTSGCLNGITPSDDTSDHKMNDSVGRDADAVVTITDEFSFDSDSVEVNVGGTVVWKNDSHQTQTVTAYEKSIPDDADYFASGGFSREVQATILYPFMGGIRPGRRFTHRFNTVGNYEYYSIPSEHLGMKGEVRVQARNS